MTSSNQPPRPSMPPRLGEPTGRRPASAGVVGLAPSGAGAPAARADGPPSGTLIVGQGIQVKGEIEACRTLVVEGRVEASIKAETLAVLKDGLFAGTAEVDQADIAGALEGALTVREQLSIAATGRVSGRIRYARIAIEAGGQIIGEVDCGPEAEARAKPSLHAAGS